MTREYRERWWQGRWDWKPFRVFCFWTYLGLVLAAIAVTMDSRVRQVPLVNGYARMYDAAGKPVMVGEVDVWAYAALLVGLGLGIGGGYVIAPEERK